MTALRSKSASTPARSKPGWPQRLVEMEEVLSGDLRQHEQTRRGSQLIARAMVRALSERFGGQVVYFPSSKPIARKKRNEAIAREYTGNNIRELAERWQLSEHQVRSILRDQGRR